MYEGTDEGAMNRHRDAPPTMSAAGNREERRVEGERTDDTPAQRSNEKDISGVFRRVTVRDSQQPVQGDPAYNGRERTAGADSISGVRPGVAQSGAPRQNDFPGFTEMFQSLAGQDLSLDADTIRVEQNARAIPPTDGSRSAQSHQNAIPEGNRPPAIGGQGEFTRLFHRLDEQGQGIVAREPVSPYENPIEQDTNARGGFTQLLRTLSNEGDGDLPPQAPQVTYSSSEGPGEFTRIISRSALREEMSRDGMRSAPAAGRPLPPADEPPNLAASPVAPQMIPGLQPSSMLAGISMNPPVGQIAPGMQSMPAPPTPAVPQPGAAGWLQQNLPLLLVANLVAMLLVLALVLFVLLRSH